MAYANLVSQTVADKVEAFCRLRDFICKRNGTYDYSTTGIGWTLHDSSYATDEDNPVLNDWFVIYSGGESGDEDLYFKITWVSNYLKIQGYQSWDASTSGGSSNYYNTANNFNFLDADVSKYLWVYGDLDFLFCFYDYATTIMRGTYFGALDCGDPIINRDIATCSSTLSSGSDVSITVDTVPADWEVGSELFIRTSHNDDMTTVEAEPITIKTLVGNTITADLTNDYTADSKLCTFFCYICQAINGTLSTAYTLMSSSGSFNQGFTHYNSAMASSYFDPSGFEDRYLLQNIWGYSATGWPFGIFQHIKTLGTSLPGSVAHGDVLVDKDGISWRVYTTYNYKVLAVKEV